MGHSSRLMVHSHYSSQIKSVFSLFLVLFGSFAKSQTPFKGLEPLFTASQNYVVYHVDNAPVIDGNINDLVWQRVNWTNEFQDIEGATKPHPTFLTKVKMLWDDSCLYIAAQITEPQVWATLKSHDNIVFRDNDFEVFIDPYNTTQPYYEIEVNALNTIFDLLLNKPYRDEGRPIISWDVKSLRSAVKIQGTMNDPSDKDEGWTVEMAIPFKSISLGARNQAPKEGALWRINFSRVEWDTKIVNGKYVKLADSAGNNLPEHNWVWSLQGVVNMHYPERWGYLQFSRLEVNSVTFNLPYAELQKQYLWLIYYRQKQWFKGHRSFALSLRDLGIDEPVTIGKKNNTLKLEGTDHQFMAWITDSESNVTYAINQEGLVRQLNIPTDE